VFSDPAIICNLAADHTELRMYTIVFESEKNFELRVNQTNGEWTINGKKANIDIHEVNPNLFNLIIDGSSYNIEVVQNNGNSATKLLKVNGNQVSAELRTSLDELLNKMGMNKAQLDSIKDIKAPMPGLILKIMAETGKSIKKGEPILILEAMKMENVIKSPVDGVIKKVLVKEKDSVPKNQVLIEF